MKTPPSRTILAAAAALLLSPLLYGQSPAPTKPPVGVPADATHFNGKWYRVYVEKGGWRRAKERCGLLGGQLATVPDEPTHAFIKELADVPLWLGASDDKIEGVWQWVDGTRMQFKAWGPRQPEGSPRENYLSLWGSEWHDVFEGEPKVVGFICEWKAK